MDALELFKVRLNRALGNLIWWEVALPTSEDWNWMVFRVLSSQNHSVILESYGGLEHKIPLKAGISRLIPCMVRNVG